jgi:hypothetical protein
MFTSLFHKVSYPLEKTDLYLVRYIICLFLSYNTDRCAASIIRLFGGTDMLRQTVLYESNYHDPERNDSHM